eukprot:jgi/Bigna1/134169/aug1.24_g8877
MRGPNHVQGLSNDLNDKKKWENVLMTNTPPRHPRPSTDQPLSRPGPDPVPKDKKSVSTPPTKAQQMHTKKTVGREEVGGKWGESEDIPLKFLDVRRMWRTPRVINQERLQNRYPNFIKSSSYVPCLVKDSLKNDFQRT